VSLFIREEKQNIDWDFVQKLTDEERAALAESNIDSASIESEMQVPFNLSNLRRHLAQIAYARKVLPEDVAARQKLLEESVYDVAVARLNHQADVFAELGLGHGGLNAPDLQKWMWEWHTKLQARLDVEIESILQAESTDNRECPFYSSASLFVC
jgi:DNA-directed RNA polymerase